MLIQFNFKNYKSFKNEASLDMSAAKITEHSGRVVNIGNDKLLKIAAIYGANASGKSNVFDAFAFMRFYVLSSFGFGGDTEQKIYAKPYMFDKISKNEKSVFEVFYIEQDDPKQKTYQYGFSIIGSTIIEEWLYSRSKSPQSEFRTVFYRNEDNIDFDGLPKTSIENLKVALEKETLIISLGAKLKIDKLKKVRDWFANNCVIDSGNPTESYFRSHTMPDNFPDDVDIQNKVIKYFESFDKSIIGFDVKMLPADEKGGIDSYIINAKHMVSGSNDFISIPFNDESGGTLEMFYLFPYIQDTIAHGSVLFVDELNSKLHPLLVRNIILTFADPEINTKNAQLIFTTHDTWQLSNNVLRRDEIWFTEKDKDGISSLYSLADFTDDNGVKIRKDENYAINYFLGKYGAIPELNSMKIFKKE